MRKILGVIAILLCLPVMAQEGEPPLPKARPADRSVPAPSPPAEDRTAPAPVAPAAAEKVPPGWAEGQLPTKPLAPLPRPRPLETNVKPAPPAPELPRAPWWEVSRPEAPTAAAAAEPAAPPRIYQVACPAVLAGKVEAKALPPISDKQCGAQSPLALTGVLANGRMVPVSGSVTTDCGMASAMPEWIEAVDSYLKAKENTGIAEVVVGTSYMCRNVDNAAEGNLSFHAFADAMDVVGFKLEDGRNVTVGSGWGDALSPEGRLLRYAHDAACSRFMTVLGPEANALHKDHFHVDLGCHGKTCTSRLCE